MKHPYLLLLIGGFSAAFGLALSFISAPKYGGLFVAIAVCDIVAVGCLLKTVQMGKGALLVSLLIGTVAMYTMADVVLRTMWGDRFLDIFYNMTAVDPVELTCDRVRVGTAAAA